MARHRMCSSLFFFFFLGGGWGGGGVGACGGSLTLCI